MALKRKRSETELSFGSVFSSMQPLDYGGFNFDAMSAMDTARRGFFAPRLTNASHLPSRTMKRFRDSRPSDSEVYQHTLDILYSAQRRHPESHHTPPLSPKDATSGTSSVEAQTHSHHNGQQRSLHSFWKLPGPASSTCSLASSPAASATSCPSPRLEPKTRRANCEDCGAGLGASDDDVMDIDGLGSSEGNQTCGAYGKVVCFSCSISNLGEHVRCLACAGPKGSQEWMTRKGWMVS